MSDELRRAMARALAPMRQPAQETFHRCPFCGRAVPSTDWILSSRLQEDGEYALIELCRACRDSGV